MRHLHSKGAVCHWWGTRHVDAGHFCFKNAATRFYCPPDPGRMDLPPYHGGEFAPTSLLAKVIFARLKHVAPKRNA